MIHNRELTLLNSVTKPFQLTLVRSEIWIDLTLKLAITRFQIFNWFCR